MAAGDKNQHTQLTRIECVWLDAQLNALFRVAKCVLENEAEAGRLLDSEEYARACAFAKFVIANPFAKIPYIEMAFNSPQLELDDKGICTLTLSVTAITDGDKKLDAGYFAPYSIRTSYKECCDKGPFSAFRTLLLTDAKRLTISRQFGGAVPPLDSDVLISYLQEYISFLDDAKLGVLPLSRSRSLGYSGPATRPPYVKYQWRMSTTTLPRFGSVVR
ncbi:hypothetical protein BD414DRAFT_283452 [Trametes punicea]|nr:hypothetical protein BD414DRAFT_283452 [Trametes punicea]